MPIVTDGLLAYWNSKQGVVGTAWTNIAPATLGNYNATITGATITTDGTKLDGVDDYLTFHIPAEIRNIIPTTFEFRLKLSNYTSEPDLIINGNVMFFTRSNGFYSLGLFGLSGGLDTPLTNNNEYYISLVSDPIAGAFIMYVNGVAVITMTNQTLKQFANNSTATQWNTANNGYYPNGIFDNVRFYNKALSSSEIAQNYAVGREVGLDSGTIYTVSLNDTVSSNDTISKRLSVIIADTVNTSESESENANKIISDSITLVDNHANLTSKYAHDNITQQDNISASSEKNISDFIEITDTISASNSNTRSINLSDSITLLDSISKALSRNISDNISITDSLYVYGGKTILLTDSINITDSISTIKHFNRTLTEHVTISDELIKAQNISLYDVIISEDKISVYDPEEPGLIGLIKLRGKRELFVYLKGSKELLIRLKGGLKVVENQNFKMVAGDSKKIIFDVDEEINGTVKWVLKKKDVEILNKEALIVGEEIHVVLDYHETENLLGTYEHSCKLFSQGEERSTLSKGKAFFVKSIINSPS